MIKWINKKRNQKGFTLIELVVVIAILGILMAIAVPRLSGFRDSAAVSADKASAATIAKAAELYVASNNIKPYSIDSTMVTSIEGQLTALYLIDADAFTAQSGTGNLVLGHNGSQFTVSLDNTVIYPE